MIPCAGNRHPIKFFYSVKKYLLNTYYVLGVEAENTVGKKKQSHCLYGFYKVEERGGQRDIYFLFVCTMCEVVTVLWRRTGKGDREFERQKDYIFTECLGGVTLITLKYRPERNKEVSHTNIWRKKSPSKGDSSAKIWRPEQAWYVQRRASLESNEPAGGGAGASRGQSMWGGLTGP